ncbi:homocysteine S-methyltransferase family protein [Leucobacter soli]|uniref:Hcy-binding domain-containing protein n=1 Tax=Leucobacter soli TaxID=2812850 RepID=A0A916JUX9_9MICO|nr:homocysteine S-methyltransferase family protein [Leucobacter soli]CAG7605563.1 hypothetical protein LEUCIP111803_00842 [Leucobacter soli]
MTIALADGGIETALEDRLGQELPEFAAFVLLDSVDGRQALRDYYRPFVELADRVGLPLVLDTPTWRANPDWLELLGYDAVAGDADIAARINAAAVDLVREVAAETAAAPVVVNGCVGPRFDDYDAAQRMTPEEAESYHAPQVAALAAAGADRVTAVTVLDAPEAIGVVRAARRAGVPSAVSFTVGADGLLASGDTLAEGIAAVDAATGNAPIGYLMNCAHPEEAARALRSGGSMDRVIGFRLNAAREGEEGPGDAPAAFAHGLTALRELAANAEIFGGCCGTDAPHIAAVAGELGGAAQ